MSKGASQFFSTHLPLLGFTPATTLWQSYKELLDNAIDAVLAHSDSPASLQSATSTVLRPTQNNNADRPVSSLAHQIETTIDHHTRIYPFLAHLPTDQHSQPVIPNLAQNDAKFQPIHVSLATPVSSPQASTTQLLTRTRTHFPVNVTMLPLESFKNTINALSLPQIVSTLQAYHPFPSHPQISTHQPPITTSSSHQTLNNTTPLNLVTITIKDTGIGFQSLHNLTNSLFSTTKGAGSGTIGLFGVGLKAILLASTTHAAIFPPILRISTIRQSAPDEQLACHDVDTVRADDQDIMVRVEEDNTTATIVSSQQPSTVPHNLLNRSSSLSSQPPILIKESITLSLHASTTTTTTMTTTQDPLATVSTTQIPLEQRAPSDSYPNNLNTEPLPLAPSSSQPSTQPTQLLSQSDATTTSSSQQSAGIPRNTSVKVRKVLKKVPNHSAPHHIPPSDTLDIIVTDHQKSLVSAISDLEVEMGPRFPNSNRKHDQHDQQYQNDPLCNEHDEFAANAASFPTSLYQPTPEPSPHSSSSYLTTGTTITLTLLTSDISLLFFEHQLKTYLSSVLPLIQLPFQVLHIFNVHQESKLLALESNQHHLVIKQEEEEEEEKEEDVLAVENDATHDIDLKHDGGYDHSSNQLDHIDTNITDNNNENIDSISSQQHSDLTICLLSHKYSPIPTLSSNFTDKFAHFTSLSTLCSPTLQTYISDLCTSHNSYVLSYYDLIDAHYFDIGQYLISQQHLQQNQTNINSLEVQQSLQAPDYSQSGSEHVWQSQGQEDSENFNFNDNQLSQDINLTNLTYTEYDGPYPNNQLRSINRSAEYQLNDQQYQNPEPDDQHQLPIIIHPLYLFTTKYTPVSQMTFHASIPKPETPPTTTATEMQYDNNSPNSHQRVDSTHLTQLYDINIDQYDQIDAQNIWYENNKLDEDFDPALSRHVLWEQRTAYISTDFLTYSSLKRTQSRFQPDLLSSEDGDNHPAQMNSQIEYHYNDNLNTDTYTYAYGEANCDAFDGYNGYDYHQIDGFDQYYDENNEYYDDDGGYYPHQYNYDGTDHYIKEEPLYGDDVGAGYYYGSQDKSESNPYTHTNVHHMQASAVKTEVDQFAHADGLTTLPLHLTPSHVKLECYGDGQYANTTIIADPTSTITQDNHNESENFDPNHFSSFPRSSELNYSHNYQQQLHTAFDNHNNLHLLHHEQHHSFHCSGDDYSDYYTDSSLQHVYYDDDTNSTPEYISPIHFGSTLLDFCPSHHVNELTNWFYHTLHESELDNDCYSPSGIHTRTPSVFQENPGFGPSIKEEVDVFNHHGDTTAFYHHQHHQVQQQYEQSEHLETFQSQPDLYHELQSQDAQVNPSTDSDYLPCETSSRFQLSHPLDNYSIKEEIVDTFPSDSLCNPYHYQVHEASEDQYDIQSRHNQHYDQQLRRKSESGREPSLQSQYQQQHPPQYTSNYEPDHCMDSQQLGDTPHYDHQLPPIKTEHCSQSDLPYDPQVNHYPQDQPHQHSQATHRNITQQLHLLLSSPPPWIIRLIHGLISTLPLSPSHLPQLSPDPSQTSFRFSSQSLQFQPPPSSPHTHPVHLVHGLFSASLFIPETSTPNFAFSHRFFSKTKRQLLLEYFKKRREEKKRLKSDPTTLQAKRAEKQRKRYLERKAKHDELRAILQKQLDIVNGVYSEEKDKELLNYEYSLGATGVIIRKRVKARNQLKMKRDSELQFNLPPSVVSLLNDDDKNEDIFQERSEIKNKDPDPTNSIPQNRLARKIHKQLEQLDQESLAEGMKIETSPGAHSTSKARTTSPNNRNTQKQQLMQDLPEDCPSIVLPSLHNDTSSLQLIVLPSFHVFNSTPTPFPTSSFNSTFNPPSTTSLTGSSAVSSSTHDTSSQHSQSSSELLVATSQGNFFNKLTNSEEHNTFAFSDHLSQMDSIDSPVGRFNRNGSLNSNNCSIPAHNLSTGINPSTTGRLQTNSDATPNIGPCANQTKSQLSPPQTPTGLCLVHIAFFLNSTTLIPLHPTHPIVLSVIHDKSLRSHLHFTNLKHIPPETNSAPNRLSSHNINLSQPAPHNFLDILAQSFPQTQQSLQDLSHQTTTSAPPAPIPTNPCRPPQSATYFSNLSTQLAQECLSHQINPFITFQFQYPLPKQSLPTLPSALDQYNTLYSSSPQDHSDFTPQNEPNPAKQIHYPTSITFLFNLSHTSQHSIYTSLSKASLALPPGYFHSLSQLMHRLTLEMATKYTFPSHALFAQSGLETHTIPLLSHILSQMTTNPTLTSQAFRNRVQTQLGFDVDNCFNMQVQLESMLFHIYGMKRDELDRFNHDHHPSPIQSCESFYSSSHTGNSAIDCRVCNMVMKMWSVEPDLRDSVCFPNIHDDAQVQNKPTTSATNSNQVKLESQFQEQQGQKKTAKVNTMHPSKYDYKRPFLATHPFIQTSCRSCQQYRHRRNSSQSAQQPINPPEPIPHARLFNIHSTKYTQTCFCAHHFPHIIAAYHRLMLLKALQFVAIPFSIPINQLLPLQVLLSEQPEPTSFDTLFNDLNQSHDSNHDSNPNSIYEDDDENDFFALADRNRPRKKKQCTNTRNIEHFDDADFLHNRIAPLPIDFASLEKSTELDNYYGLDEGVNDQYEHHPSDFLIDNTTLDTPHSLSQFESECEHSPYTFDIPGFRLNHAHNNSDDEVDLDALDFNACLDLHHTKLFVDDISSDGD